MDQQHATLQNDLIFDLGMHRGEDTNLYLAKGFRVVAFEANPELVELGRKRFAGQLASGQLHLVEGAIIEQASEQDSVTFFVNENSVWGTTQPTWKTRNEREGWSSVEITVPTVDFHKCLAEYGIPYYMKIDMEGVDMYCLRSLGKFNVKPCYVSIESNKVSMAALRDELDVLESLGYHAFQAVQQATMSGRKVPRPAREGLDIDFTMERHASGPFGRDLCDSWKTRKQIESAYKKIFWSYAVCGDDSFIRNNRFTRPFLMVIQMLFNRAIPGWYDTHARHAEAPAVNK